MFKPTDKQRGLFELETMLPEPSSKRLMDSWANGFAQKVLPIVLNVEPEFQKLYSEKMGRPNWSVARMLGICILQEMQNKDDQTALDCLTFDARWQYALGLTPKDAYLSRRSLVDFRSRMVLVDPEMKVLRSVFNKVTDSAISDLKISTKQQRIDSTIITSNISTYGRLDLFKKTLVKFIKWLSNEQPKEFLKVNKTIRNWYRKIDDGGWFGMVAKFKKNKKQEMLITLATWLHDVEVTFAKTESVKNDERYLLVKRLISEHCEFESSKTNNDNSDDADKDNDKDNDADAISESRNINSKIKLCKKVKHPHHSMQSPHDPDAGYSGHKGPGYLAHVTETCNNKNTEIITDYFVVPAGELDSGKAPIAVENLKQSNKKPEKLFADAGYPTAQGVVDLEKDEVELIAPITIGNMKKDAIKRDAFQYSSSGECVACPQGHAPVKHGMRTSSSKPDKALHAFFDSKFCNTCSLLKRCMVRPPNNKTGKKYHIEIDPALVKKDRNMTLQQDEAWWKTYKIRAGIEATMSELKRVNGLGKLRVRRKPRVTLAVSLKTTACNVKRWIRASKTSEMCPA